MPTNPILDQPLTADAVYDLFVNRSDTLAALMVEWYREAKGRDPAVSDIQHGIYRAFEPQQFTSRWGTLRRALQDTWPLDVTAPAPSDVRPLHIEGATFRDDTGALFQWRGYSWFLGYRRFLAGEDVTADLRQLRAMGFNLVRVFGPLDWPQTPDYNYAHFNPERLGEFFALTASEGFYCEFVIGCYRFGDVTAQRQFAQRVYDIARHHPNVLIEAVNEPSVGGKPDPVAMLAGVDRHGVLSAYGIHLPYYTQAQDELPTLDYCTIHTTRDSAWHRKARHAQELQHQLGKPTISDEPAKITEPDFDYPGGKNDPLHTPAEMVWHAAVCCLWTPGCTVHTEEGKWGRVPTVGMLQYTVLEAVQRDVWTRIGPEWQTGQYKGAHSSGSPVDGDGLQINGQDIWTYSSVHPTKALAVRCALSEPRAINGWRMAEAWGPSGSLVRLER